MISAAPSDDPRGATPHPGPLPQGEREKITHDKPFPLPLREGAGGGVTIARLAELRRQNDVTALLDLTGISKAFGGAVALREVDFSLEPGEIHGLVGENGAGKSTLMKIIAGLPGEYQGVMRLDAAEALGDAPQLERKLAGRCHVVHAATTASATTVCATTTSEHDS